MISVSRQIVSLSSTVLTELGALRSELNNVTGSNTSLTDRVVIVENTLPSKVDKIAGKGLSTNDLTDTLKQIYDTSRNNS